VLASGWIGRGLDVLTGSRSAEGPGILLWLVTPMALSLLLRIFFGDGWKDFGIRPNFRGNAAPYAAALLVFPVMTTLVLLIGGISGLVTFPGLTAGAVVLILQTFALGVLPQFVKNIFEEFAWRGYLAPKVYSLGLNDYAAHLIVGFVWGAWHIPYYLYFLDRAVIRDFTTLNLALFIPSAVVVMMVWAIMYGEILLLTGSIWPAVLMHMVEDAFLNQLFAERHIQILPGTDWLVSPLNGVVSIVLYVAFGIALRRWRKKRAGNSFGAIP
jgi:hypothetical protein